jgi:inhibitor of KinA
MLGLGYRVLPAGDTALVVDFGERVDRRLNATVLSLARNIDAAGIDGITETVPTFRSLLIHYDPLVLSAASLMALIDRNMQELTSREITGQVWHLPVCYDSQFAIDLDDVARRASLATQRLVERHCAPTYHVYMLGFLPGQAYMGENPPELVLDRLETPRTRIPAGSLAIAGAMSCVFPMQTPCGWHVIGRCPIALWDKASASALLAPGDKVLFVPVSMREYERLARRAAEGTLRLEPVSNFAEAVA